MKCIESEAFEILNILQFFNNIRERVSEFHT